VFVPCELNFAEVHRLNIDYRAIQWSSLMVILEEQSRIPNDCVILRLNCATVIKSMKRSVVSGSLGLVPRSSQKGIVEIYDTALL
jgi:hypothetical protein